MEIVDTQVAFNSVAVLSLVLRIDEAAVRQAKHLGGVGVGLSSVGLSSVGLSSVGLSSVGPSSVGLSSVGLSSVGLSSVGLSSVGRGAISQTPGYGYNAPIILIGYGYNALVIMTGYGYNAPIIIIGIHRGDTSVGPCVGGLVVLSKSENIRRSTAACQVGYAR